MSPKFSFKSPKFCLLLVSILATFALLSCQQAQPPANVAENRATPAQTETAKKAAPTDLEALANRLVTQVAGVKEGEIVFINGGVRDLELLENIKYRRAQGRSLSALNNRQRSHVQEVLRRGA